MSLNLIKPALWLNCFAYAYAFKLVIKVTIQEASDIILDFFFEFLLSLFQYFLCQYFDDAMKYS